MGTDDRGGARDRAELLEASQVFAALGGIFWVDPCIEQMSYNWSGQIYTHPLIGNGVLSKGKRGAAFPGGALLFKRTNFVCFFYWDKATWEEYYPQLRNSDLGVFHTFLRKGEWICRV